MRKWFGARPSAVRLDVSIGRGPLPRVSPKEPSSFLRDGMVRTPRPTDGRHSWVRIVVIALIAIVCVAVMLNFGIWWLGT